MFLSLPLRAIWPIVFEKLKIWPISCDEIAIHSLGHTVTGFWALQGLAYLRWAELRSGTYGLFSGWAKYEHVFKVANGYPLFKYSMYPTCRKSIWILCFLDLHDNWVWFYILFFLRIRIHIGLDPWTWVPALLQVNERGEVEEVSFIIFTQTLSLLRLLSIKNLTRIANPSLFFLSL